MKSSEEGTVIASIQSKGNNRRVNVYFIKDHVNDTPVIAVKLKRLIDFKTRNVFEVTNCYTAETFLVLLEAFKLLSDSNVFADEMQEIANMMANKTEYVTNLSTNLYKEHVEKQKGL